MDGYIHSLACGVFQIMRTSCTSLNLRSRRASPVASLCLRAMVDMMIVYLFRMPSSINSWQGGASIAVEISALVGASVGATFSDTTGSGSGGVASFAGALPPVLPLSSFFFFSSTAVLMGLLRPPRVLTFSASLL